MGWGSLIPVGKVTDTVDPIALIYSSDGEAEAHRVEYYTLIPRAEWALPGAVLRAMAVGHVWGEEGAQGPHFRFQGNPLVQLCSTHVLRCHSLGQSPPTKEELCVQLPASQRRGQVLHSGFFLFFWKTSLRTYPFLFSSQ